MRTELNTGVPQGDDGYGRLASVFASDSERLEAFRQHRDEMLRRFEQCGHWAWALEFLDDDPAVVDAIRARRLRREERNRRAVDLLRGDGWTIDARPVAPGYWRIDR